MTSHIRDLKPLPHHAKREICASRPSYREGRKLTAVRVYTINQESLYVIIRGVPSVGASQELQDACQEYGDIVDFQPLDNYEGEEYTETYLVKYARLVSAKFAKKKLDERSFFGRVLHVCFAPELETVEETRAKLNGRRRFVASKTGQQPDIPSVKYQTKRKSGSHDLQAIQSTETVVWAGKEIAVDRKKHLFPTPGSSCTPDLNSSYAVVNNQPLRFDTGPMYNDQPLSFNNPGPMYNDQPLSFNSPGTMYSDQPQSFNNPGPVFGAHSFNTESKENSGPTEKANDDCGYSTTVSEIKNKIQNVSVPNLEVSFKRRKKEDSK